MAEPTNTDALHQGNESTEEMQRRRSYPPRLGAGFLMEQRGPLLGRHRASPRGSAKLRFIVATPATIRKVRIRTLWIRFLGLCSLSHFSFFFFFLAMLHGMWDLSFRTRDGPLLPAVETQNLNHWLAREVTFTF